MDVTEFSLDAEGRFIIYALERYRQVKGLTGREVIELFNTWNVLEFLRESYDLLHINGDQCLIMDIDEHIARMQQEIKVAPR